MFPIWPGIWPICGANRCHNSEIPLGEVNSALSPTMSISPGVSVRIGASWRSADGDICSSFKKGNLNELESPQIVEVNDAEGVAGGVDDGEPGEGGPFLWCEGLAGEEGVRYR